MFVCVYLRTNANVFRRMKEKYPTTCFFGGFVSLFDIYESKKSGLPKNTLYNDRNIFNHVHENQIKNNINDFVS